MTHPLLLSARRIGGIVLMALVFPVASTLAAQEWIVVDTFADGETQGAWTVDDGMVHEVRSGDVGHYLFTASATGNTHRAHVILPQPVSAGKVTIAFDFFAPGGNSLNQVGFGAGSADMVERSTWASVGGSNRFQMADRTPGAFDFAERFPQFLAKAGDWSTDVLAPTVPGVWYNLWIVYDLDAGEFSFYSRRADAESEAAEFRGQWPFVGPTAAEDYAEISRFAIAGGGTGNPDAPTLGGRFANIHMAVGENLSLTPASIQLDPPAWQAVDTFFGSSPNADWAGDLNQFHLDFSEGYLHMLPTAGTGSPRGGLIRAELPQTVQSGIFTVTFDFFINGPSTSRSDVSFAAVGDAQLAATDPWGQRGGATRLGTFGPPPQAFRAFSPPSTVAIPGSEVQEQWYHAWIVYNTTAQRIDFHYAPFGSGAPPGTPAASWSFDPQVDYSNFTHFVVGLDRPTSTGLRLGNIYFAADELLTLSPTAGTFTPIEEIFALQPSDTTVRVDSTARFSAALTGPQHWDLRWQISLDHGLTFSDLPENPLDTFTGTTTAELVVNPASEALESTRFRLKVSSQTGQAFSQPVRLYLRTHPTLAEWAADQGLSPGQSAPGFRHTGIGLTTLEAFAFGLNPMEAILPSQMPTLQREGNELLLRYRRNIAVHGLSFVIETSTDLVAWHTAEGADQLLFHEGETIEVREAAFTNDGQPRFLRLRLEVAE
ncbi:MAG: hypothetical protein JJT96_01950 [Opitutales bacterium]|nr:hypothetical protein [Opitutales bacterium]